ncbi:conserved protein of unknown function [Sterolibacterium denitrificans]|uniref:Uncharacterized protein n=2 Tax=Sterolibacterium denitrificans TaxID=157592 RepID=A0A7Z7MTW8_9PROT|nr:DUF1214 domain-containing protein [Sterolibacterium denitrificans]KYC28870.1 hypothetical protein ACY05_04140 [Sterolibacterium denitrificans]SMB21135.1 conserved protein of unknown function [Sterolibacterium denitrificans]
MNDPALDSVLSGATWEAFCDTLKRAGQQILRPEAPDDAFNRAEGWRYLSRLIRIALEMHVEYADPRWPGFIQPSHETVKIGGDNPDNLYLSARIDGRYDYRVWGTRGSVSALGFSTKSGGYAANRDGRMECNGFIDAAQMNLDEDGNFELILSQQPPSGRPGKPGNWLPMRADTNQLLVRQTFLDRATEQPARIHIERLGGDAATAAPATPAALDPATLHENLQRAARFVENTARLFADWAQLFQTQEANTLPPRDQAMFQAAGGDPNIFYYHGYWRLAPDEALVIELERSPDCDFWNFQVDNYWMESLDYRYHRVHHNAHTARPNPDGSLTLIVAHRPCSGSGLGAAHPNWLETAGHDLGTMCFRLIGAREPMQRHHPQTRVVKLAELSARYAPADALNPAACSP